MNILVIGCGSIGQRHIRNLLSLSAGEISAFDINEEKLSQVKNISDSINVANNLRKLWGKKPKIAFICVPTALHVKYALEAAYRNCHLFIEKPLSNNLKGIDKLIKVVNQKKLVSFVGYNYRFNRSIIRIGELLRKRIIGNIIYGRTHFGSYLPNRHPGEDYRDGYGAKKVLGGGVILDAISHHLDYVILLFGKPKEVMCYSSKHSGLEIDVEDTAEILLKYDKKIFSLHGNFLQQPYKHTFELIGDSGTIYCDFVANELKYYNITRKKWITYPSMKEQNAAYMEEIKCFLKAVEKNKKVPVDIFKSKEELEILMSIKKSAKIKSWVKI